jgi:hypothetical protein
VLAASADGDPFLKWAISPPSLTRSARPRAHGVGIDEISLGADAEFGGALV